MKKVRSLNKASHFFVSEAVFSDQCRTSRLKMACVQQLVDIQIYRKLTPQRIEGENFLQTVECQLIAKRIVLEAVNVILLKSTATKGS